MKITRIPSELSWMLRVHDLDTRGECYFNSGSLVILSAFENKFSTWLSNNSWQITYILGILTPPPHDEKLGISYDTSPEPHAWIEAKDNDGNIYWWDPTLQQNSRVWAARHRDFMYDKRHEMNAEQIKLWFSENYKGAEFTDYGVPECDCSFPKIDLEGRIL